MTAEPVFSVGQGIPDTQRRETASSLQGRSRTLSEHSGDKDPLLSLSLSHYACRLVASGLLTMPERKGLCGCPKAVRVTAECYKPFY